ncbi:MAG: capsule assembly Wzi family protein [Sphingobacteriales bacterium]|jgi:hypothetical protein
MKHSIFFAVFLMLITYSTSAQVWENHRSEVYPYLYRMAQKGFIEFNDVSRPLSRQQIYQWLDELQQKKQELTDIEKQELSFYIKEYKPLVFTDSTSIRLGKKDQNGRWRLLSLGTKDFEVHVDPILSVGYVSGNTTHFRQVSNGAQLWGKAGKISFQVYYRDVTETGTGLDTFRKESPETGIIKVGPGTKPNAQNFSDLRGHISYSWKNGSLSFGKDQFIWGYGENGRVVLSDKAPSYAYLRFDYRPLKWLHYQQIHGWLNSNIVDSNRSYPTGTVGTMDDVRLVFHPKFMAHHSVTLTPWKGWAVSFGESMIYSDTFDPIYLVPVMLYKVYDNNKSVNLNAGSNGQIFGQISSRNHIPKTHVYSTLFIDEIRLSTLLDDKKRRTQIGINLGFNTTDFLLPYLTIGAEYTRINPFVYQNFIPTQHYTHHNHLLGDWMGANADRFLAYVRYNPAPRVRTILRIQQTRKGSVGSIHEQYFAEPQNAFLSGFIKKRTDLFFQANYEWANNLYIHASLQWMRQEPHLRSASSEQMIQMGVSYGLR